MVRGTPSHCAHARGSSVWALRGALADPLGEAVCRAPAGGVRVRTGVSWRWQKGPFGWTRLADGRRGDCLVRR